ncbi:hypothetical protein INT47_011865 [Mucor saturninus]|uniref:Uncharacterized protein n=1 Tax=Mucor saturninus TaxID=64648 RepID=A0A8H7RC31_9FUNG|nr:hypothetical protein INT47_011865 [Mucor saturninus]
MTISPTYYTPPSGDRNKSVIPHQIFHKEKRRLFHERVIIGEDSPEIVTLETKGAEDMFGWVEMVDNTCIAYLRNKYAQKLSDEYPQARAGFFTI